MIQSRDLTKKYESLVAVNEVNFDLQAGEIYGFLGLNGAGKTTMIRMLLGMTKPDKGIARLNGKTVQANFGDWNTVGYLVEKAAAYPNLTVVENLQIHYTLRGLKDKTAIHEVIEKLNLTAYADRKAGKLSMGNLQRLALAKALMHQPKILMLDEPVNGLDPAGMQEVRKLLASLAENGACILISSHILGEISKLAHRIGIIHHGKLIGEFDREALHKNLQKFIVIESSDVEKTASVVKSAGIAISNIKSNEIRIPARDVNSQELLKILIRAECPISQYFVETEDLEAYFLRLTRAHD